MYRLDVTDFMPFGKYKGKTLEWIIDNDIGYAKWMIFDSDLRIKLNVKMHYELVLNDKHNNTIIQ